MTAPELKMVADHMGHNIDVHTDVYRLQSSILEKTKVARVLIAVENGSVNRFQGKQLQDISINGKNICSLNNNNNNHDAKILTLSIDYTL